ncbi:unnamed protein product [Linum trigynum]|uniref:Uncharacterized protein n=1 Tax=Linum trigynum TaxID=586398 RepID=A0AAV2D7Z6_9ROSI
MIEKPEESSTVEAHSSSWVAVGGGRSRWSLTCGGGTRWSLARRKVRVAVQIWSRWTGRAGDSRRWWGGGIADSGGLIAEQPALLNKETKGRVEAGCAQVWEKIGFCNADAETAHFYISL